MSKKANPLEDFLKSLNVDALSEGEYTCDMVHPALRKAIDELPDVDTPESEEVWGTLLSPLDRQLRQCIATESLKVIALSNPLVLMMPAAIEMLLADLIGTVTLSWLVRERVAQILAEGNDGQVDSQG